MSDQSTSPQPTLQAGDELHGFKVLRVEAFPEIRITAYEIEQKKPAPKFCTCTLWTGKIYMRLAFVLRRLIRQDCRISWNILFWRAPKNIRLKTFSKN